MGAIRNNMIVTMRNQGYSEKTIKLYTTSVRALASHYNKTPLDISAQQVADYIFHLRARQKSDSTVRVYFEAIKYFFRINRLTDRIPHITLGKVRHKLPTILSQTEVLALLDSCSSLKDKTIFTLIYSAGLRVSEAAQLQLNDINFERKTILVRNGKNKKDRYTLLANETIRLLRDYMRVYHPQTYVFYSVDVFSGISVDCIQKHFKRLILSNHIDPSVHVHTLRHCFATHLLENGTSIFYIMNLLGHSNIQTTMIYLHMESLELLNIQSPIDKAICSQSIITTAKTQYLFQDIA
jgi:site-specific recombinase XerD